MNTWHGVTPMERLARFCVQTRFDDLPPALVNQAKRHILDTFGAALAGAGSEVARQASPANATAFE